MATIKAGTYRFNDVLDMTTFVSIYDDQEQIPISFTIPSGFGLNTDTQTLYLTNETLLCNYIFRNNEVLCYSAEGSASPVYANGLGWNVLPVVYAELGFTATDDFDGYGQTITIPEDSEVSAEFYEWFNANAVEVVEETPAATITYNGSTIATLNGGQTATIKCAGNKMKSDIVVEVAEQTGGECSGTHVIEVDELPTENIDEDALYLCNGGYYKYAEEFSDVRPCGEGQDLTGVDGVPTFSEALGLPIASYHYAPTMPTENIEVSTETGLAVYYIEDANNLFAYVGEWISLTDMFPDIPFLGAISDASESTEAGYYAILSIGWKALTISSGTLKIIENGNYDIADKMNVNVSIPTTYVVQTASDLSADAPNGSLAIVLGG